MPPNVTALAFVKFVPVIATLVPPPVPPLDVPRLEIVGALTAEPVEYVNWSALTALDVPPLFPVRFRGSAMAIEVSRSNWTRLDHATR